MNPRSIPLALSSLALAHVAQASVDPVFHGTDDPVGHWFVSTVVNPAGEGQESSFSTASFTQAVNLSQPGRTEWIADVESGNHGPVGTWTQFVFRQTFDLSGFDPATANLSFRWAADDSGEIFAMRGSWIPAFRLNGGAFTYYPGASPGNRIPTYDYSSLVSLTSGFVGGLNTIDFYVQGNGVTDGFALQLESFTATAVPAPGALVALGAAGALGSGRLITGRVQGRRRAGLAACGFRDRLRE